MIITKTLLLIVLLLQRTRDRGAFTKATRGRSPAWWGREGALGAKGQYNKICYINTKYYFYLNKNQTLTSPFLFYRTIIPAIVDLLQNEVDIITKSYKVP